MDNKSVIEKFNEKCAPFYLVDHENGTFSLCYPFSFVDEKYRFYGQEAFDKYAERIGEPPVTSVVFVPTETVMSGLLFSISILKMIGTSQDSTPIAKQAASSAIAMISTLWSR